MPLLRPAFRLDGDGAVLTQPRRETMKKRMIAGLLAFSALVAMPAAVAEHEPFHPPKCESQSLDSIIQGLLRLQRPWWFRCEP